MNQKIDITKYVADQMGLGTDDRIIRRLVATWWQNTRKKDKGGLRLTEKGFECLSEHIKSHKVRFQEEFIYSNQLVIWLDHFIDCPWYLTNKAIFVFDDKIAIQLVLFSGNIEKFSRAKARSLKST